MTQAIKIKTEEVMTISEQRQNVSTRSLSWALTKERTFTDLIDGESEDGAQNGGEEVRHGVESTSFHCSEAKALMEHIRRKLDVDENDHIESDAAHSYEPVGQAVKLLQVTKLEFVLLRKLHLNAVFLFSPPVNVYQQEGHDEGE